MIHECKCGCGAKFERTEKYPIRVFFDAKCRKIYAIRKLSEERAAARVISGPIIIPCEVCREMFERKTNVGKYCSPECANKKKRDAKKKVCRCGMLCTENLCRACFFAEKKAEARKLNADMDAERKQRQADIIAHHSIKLNLTRDIAPKPTPVIKPAPARTWQNCPDRSAKTGRCAKHDKPCFDVRTRTALCNR